MLNYKLTKSQLLIISVMGISCSLLIIFALVLGLPLHKSNAKVIPALTSQITVKALSDKIDKSKVSSIVPAKLSLNQPSRLLIPRLKLNVALESVGLTAQGAVAVPREITNAAWFNQGPRPGELGNAVITGHYGFYQNGLRGVFNNLAKLRPGDKLSVVDRQGITKTFIVRELKSYSLKDDASAVFIASDGGVHLNIITCEGVWNAKTKSYSRRLVVFADQEKP